MLNRDQKFMDFCIRESMHVAPIAGARVFACLAIKNRIISVGFSSAQSNPFQQKFSKNEKAIYLHAENMAIWKAINSRNKVNPHEHSLASATLYVARTLKNKSQALAKPCCGCIQAIVHFGIKKVFYTTDIGIEQL